MSTSVFCPLRLLVESSPIRRMFTTSSSKATVGTGVGLEAGVGVTDGLTVTVMVCVGSRVGVDIWGVRDGAGVSVGVWVGVRVAVADGAGEGVLVRTVGLGAIVAGAAVGRGLGVLDGVGDMTTVGLAATAGLETRAPSAGVGPPAHDANMLNMSSKPQASPLDEGLADERHDLRTIIITCQYRNG